MSTSGNNNNRQQHPSHPHAHDDDGHEHESGQIEGEEVVAEYYLDENDVLQEVVGEDDEPMDDADGEGEVELEGDEDDIVLEDNSLAHFDKHGKSVFVVHAHPRLPIAVSGGEDDLGYIWNIEDGEQLVKLSGHTDSVSAAQFSADGELVATGGMDGKVRVWRRVSTDQTYKTWEFLTELQGPDEVIVSVVTIEIVARGSSDVHTVVEVASQGHSPPCWLERWHGLALATYVSSSRL